MALSQGPLKPAAAPVRASGYMCVYIDRTISIYLYLRMCGWMDTYIEGWMDAWMDGRVHYEAVAFLRSEKLTMSCLRRSHLGHFNL